MKNLLLYCLVLLAFTSCKKENSGSPASEITNDYAALNITAKTQVVNMFVNDNVLNMAYNEDVTVLINANKIKQFDAVHLKEYFAGTGLAELDYHSIATNGVNALNWVDDNLNNLAGKNSKDTLIAGNAFVKKHILRTFTYQKEFDSAYSAYQALIKLEKQTDIITFSTFYSPSTPDVLPVNNTAKLTYLNVTKGDITSDERL